MRVAAILDSEPSLPEPVMEFPPLPVNVGAFGKREVGTGMTRMRRGSRIGIGLPSEVKDRAGQMMHAEPDDGSATTIVGMVFPSKISTFLPISLPAVQDNVFVFTSSSTARLCILI